MNLRRLILALLPFALPLYVVRFQIGPLPTTLLEISIAIFLAAWLLSSRPKLRATSYALRSSSWFWPLTLWITAGLISVFIAEDKLGALGLFRAYFIEPVLVFIMLCDLVRTDHDRRVLIQSMIGVTVLVALWAIAQRLGLLPIPSPWNAPPAGIRSTGPFPFPNALALFAVPVAALCFSLALRATRYELCAVWPWSGFVAGVIATFLAQSEGGLIAIAAAAFIACITHHASRIKWTAIGLTMAVAVLILVIPSVRQPVSEKILFKDWSGKVRLVMWGETWQMLKDRPVFGAGLGGYPDAIKPYHKATWMEIFQYPHTILFNLWSETGLIGIAAFAWILWAWARKDYRLQVTGDRPPQATSYELRATLPLIAALLVHGLVDVPYFKNDLAVMFWMLIALSSSR